MLKLLIRRRLIPYPCPPIGFTFSSSLSFDSDSDDPPFTPVTVNSPKLQITDKKKKKKQSPINSNRNSESAPNFPIKSYLPFDFRYSYTEANTSVQPIGFREPPRFSPFGPGRLDRKWTGTCAPQTEETTRRWMERRHRVLGEPLSEDEVDELVEKYRHNDCNRQINIGNRGVTHNMLDDIHNHWKRAEAVRLKCLGVPALDMDNIKCLASHHACVLILIKLTDEYFFRKSQVGKLSTVTLMLYFYIEVGIIIQKIDLLFL